MASYIQSALSLSPSDIEQLIADRRDVHAHPELGYNEQRTASLVAERLAGHGYEGRPRNPIASAITVTFSGPSVPLGLSNSPTRRPSGENTRTITSTPF